jgi:xylan 1,4-beta-xylosidase
MRLLIIFLCIFTTAYAQQSQAQIQQQVIPGELPDPSIIEVEGVYYACGSSNDWGPVYPIYKSTDLKNWTFVNYVFSERPSWTQSSYWAPELYYHNNTFYCYYTAKRNDGISCIGVATTKNIENGFQDEGVIIEWGNEAIDAFVYNENETLYITWKAYGLTPDKPIQILGSELSEDGLSLKGEAFEILTANADSWEKGGAEGQCIVKHNGYLYMIYSGNACCGGGCDYKVGVARAKTMQGTWEKFEKNPLMESNDTWKCPGHGTAINTDNKWYYLYHSYPDKGFPYIGRTCLLSEIKWDRGSGWPYFKTSETKTEQEILTNDIQDDFCLETMADWWRYDIPAYSFTTKIKNSKLTLIEDSRSSGNQTGTALCVVPDDADFTTQTKICNENQALKGLVFYATNNNSLGIGTKGKDLILWKVKDGSFNELNRITLKKTKNIHLKAEAKEGHIIEFFYSKNGEKWMAVPNTKNESDKVIGNNLSWWSWGMKTGILVKTDSETEENKAVFDHFEIEYQ